ncbi:MAG: carbohydrate kinase family protein, partial [Halarsenatibacteraceae bacterium]
MLLDKSELAADCFADTEIFHFGTISLTDQPVRAATYYLLDLAAADGVFVSFDPNIRLPLWDNDFIRLEKEFKKALAYVNLLKLNLDELALLTGVDLSEEDLKESNQALENKVFKAAQKLMIQGPDQIIVTAGKYGSFYCGKEEVIYQSAEKVKAVDTTGAGDAFMAGIISEIVREIKADNLAGIDWLNTLAAANRFGAITSSRYGAIPALPEREEIL